jgi:hypothetical protein
MLNDEAILTHADEILKVSQVHTLGPPRHLAPRESRLERKLTRVNKSLQMILLDCIDGRLADCP